MGFPDIVFKHIPRSDNYRADALVNKVLNEQASSFKRATPNRPLEPPQRHLFHSNY
jgi:hypothetical protein